MAGQIVIFNRQQCTEWFYKQLAIRKTDGLWQDQWSKTKNLPNVVHRKSHC